MNIVTSYTIDNIPLVNGWTQIAGWLSSLRSSLCYWTSFRSLSIRNFGFCSSIRSANSTDRAVVKKPRDFPRCNVRCMENSHFIPDILFLVRLLLFLSPQGIDVGFICISKDIHKILAIGVASNLYFYFLQDH